MKTTPKKIGIRRSSASPVYNLPPISFQARTSSETTREVSPFSVYTTIKNQTAPTCQRFFSLKPLIQSPNTEVSTSRSIHTSQEVSPKKFITHSDITERIDSYELRIKKSFDFETLQENFYMWERCYNEILPEIKKQTDIGPGVIKICVNYADIIKRVFKFVYMKDNEDKSSYNSLYQQYCALDAHNKQLVAEMDEFKKYQKLDMEKIQKEIEEIFGKNDLEISELRNKSKEHKDNFNKNTEYMLKEIWTAMNQEFNIPELKNLDFIGMDPNDIPGLLSDKFYMVQKYTAKRIVEIIRSRKNLIDKSAQTTAVYIDPKHHDEQTKVIEKLHLQLQSALASVEKYRESFRSKINILDTLELEKTSALNEVSKLKKDNEHYSNSVDKLNLELKKFVSELNNTQKDKETLLSEKAQLTSELSLNQKNIIELKITIDKLEKNIKDGTEKIKFLENNLAKRRKNNDVAETPAKPSEKPSAKFNDKDFMNFIKSGKKRDSIKDSRKSTPEKMSNRERNSISSNQQEININSSSPNNLNNLINPSSPSNLSNQESNKIMETQARSIELNSGYNTKNTRKVPADRRVSSRNPKNDLNRIDEVKSPSYRLSINDVDSQYREKFGSTKSRERSQGTGEESYFEGNAKEKSKIQKRRHHKDRLEGVNYEEDNYSRSDESNDEYHTKKFYENGLKPSGSNYSNESREGLSENEGKRNVLISTEELTFIIVLQNSIGIQCNGNVPDADANEGSERVYILPYNPNQYYGLRGDSYYHTTHSIFHAQPRIPDLKDSYMFQSSYHLKDH